MSEVCFWGPNTSSQGVWKPRDSYALKPLTCWDMSLLPVNITTLEDKDYEKMIATPISMIKKSQTLNKIVDLVKTYFV